MNIQQQRLLVFACMGLFTALLFTQSNRETPFSKRIHQQHTKPFVEAQLYGVVTEVRNTSLELENLIYSRNVKEFVCQDLQTNGLDRYEVSKDEPIQVDDTIQKGAGQNWFVLFRKNGRVYRSHPIDRRS